MDVRLSLVDVTEGSQHPSPQDHRHVRSPAQQITTRQDAPPVQTGGAGGGVGLTGGIVVIWPGGSVGMRT